MKKSISTFFLTLALVLMSVVGASAQQVAWSEDFGDNCSISGTVATLTALGWDTLGYQAGTTSSSVKAYHWRTYTGGVEDCCARLYAHYYYISEESLISPSVAMPTSDDYMLSFKFKNASAGNGDLDVFVVAGGTTTYLEQHITGVAAWTTKVYSLAAYRGQSIRIGFKGRSGASTIYTYFIDDVEVKKAPTCQKPVSLAASGLSTNSANLSWTYQGTGFGDIPSKCYVTVTDAGGTVVKTDSTSAGAYSISLTGLQPNTTYTATVYGDCRSNYSGVSESSSVTFTTMLSALNPPYEETFDALSALPDGSNTSGNVSINTTPTYAYGAAGKSLKMTITGTANAMFITPLINLSADNTEVEFQLKSANSGTNIKFSAGYMTDVSDIGTYVPMINDSIYQTTEWKEVRFNTSEMAGYDSTNPIMIAIQIQGGAAASVYVDNLQAHVIPTCIRPEAVTVSNVTANTAEVAWTTSNANNHVIRLQNLSDSTWMTFNAGVSPYTITGLSQNTQYGNLTVQGVCSATDSSTVKRTLISFKTLCDVSPTAIFFEGADGTTGSALPDCWLTGLIQQGTGTSGSSYDEPFCTQNTSTYVCSGTRSFQLRDQKVGTISYLSSQAMNFEQVGKYSFRYSIYRPSGTNYNGEGLKVYVTPTPGDTTNGVLVIPFVNRMAGNSPAGTSGCNTYEGIINYGGTGHITIVGYSQWGAPTYFDNLEVFLTPSCPKPGSISTSNLTSSSIDLSWNAGNTETQWLLSYSVTQGGQVVDAATVTVSNQPTYTISNLSPATNYSVNATLRALCGVGDTSEVVTMPAASFTTACASISIFPYRENFESMTANAAVPCWSTAASTATAYTSYYLWGVYSYSSNKSIRMYNYSVNNGNAVIDMPQMTLLNVPMKWTFDYSHRASCDSLNAQVSTDGVNFTTLGSFGQTDSSTSSTDPGAFTSVTIDLSAYQGQTVTLRFAAVANYGYGAIWVDNIVVRAIPTCPDVDANPTLVDGTTATLTLDTTMTTWQISLGNTPGDSIIDVTGASTYTLTGLTPTTLYRYYVRSVCGTNYGDWSQSHSFTTTKLCPDLTAIIDNVTATSALVTKDATIPGNWQIAVDADTIIDVAGATYTLTGLTPGTTYTIRVRKDCGNGTYGDWSADYTVVTPALPATLPYVCDFEDVQENNRWTFVDGAGVNVFTIGTATTGVYAGTSALYITNNRTTGAHNYDVTSASRPYAYRDIHFESRGYQVNFKVKATGGESTYDFGRVFLTTAATTIPSGEGGSGSYSGVTFPTMVAAFDDGYTNGSYQMFNLSSCPSSVRDENGWVTISYFLDMTTKAAGDYKFVVMWNDDTSAGTNPPIAIDNINIYELTCIPPSTVLTNAITSTSADLDIQQQDVSEWEVLVHTSAIDVENLPDSPYYRQITTSKIVSLTGLTPNTDYYYTVRAICGASDTSAWKTPDMFHTQCASVNIPLMEGFDNANSTKCWTNIGTGTISHSTSYKKTGTGSMQIAATIGISPEFITDSLTNFMINGWARSTVDSATFSVGIMNDPNDATSFEPLTDVTIPTSGTWFEFTSYFTALNDDDYEDWRYAKYVGIATGTYTIYFDDVIIDLTPTCPKPTEVSITNVLAHSFDIAFTDNTGGTANSWSVKVNGAAQTITTNPATITGLNAATAYTIEVAAICSATDMSYYTAAGTIKTTCDLVNPPYSEDFSTHTVGAAPDCWDNTTSTSTPLSAVYAVYDYNGNKMVRVNDWYASSGGQAVLTSPIIALPQGGLGYVFGFDYDCASTSITSPSVAISTNAGSTWTTLANLSTGTSPTESGADPTPGTLTRYTYDISSYAGNNVMFKFECTTAYGSGGLFIDNVSVKALLSCSDPDAPVVSNVTATTADVTFTDTCAAHTQWQYVAGVAGFDPSTATPTTITSTNFSLSGLQDDANIMVYVRAYCGAGDTSNWVGSSLKTLCLPFTVSENNTFYESFEGYPYGDNLGSSCYTLSPANGNIRVVPSSDPSGYTYGNYYSHDGDYTNKALYATNASYSDPAGIYIQRPFHLEAGKAYEISAWVLPTSYGAQFSILAGFNGTVTTMDTLITRTMAAAQIEYDEDWNLLYNEAYEKISTIFSPDSTADYILSLNAMYAPSSYYLYVYFDELQVRQFTGCAPSQVSVDSIATNSAVVTLSDSDPTHSFQYVLNDTTLAVTTSTSNHFSLTGLAAATTYTLYVRTLCDSTSYSEWVNVQFTTACGHINTFPYVQDFESMSSGSSVPCWPISGSSASVTANPSYIWGVYNYSGNNSIRMYNFYASYGTALINMPTIELPTQPIELSFDYSHLASCGAAYVKISTNGGTSYTDLFTFTSPSTSYSYSDPGTFSHALIDLSAYAGSNVDIQFYATANYGSGAIWIDNVTFSYVPACRGPQVAPTVTATTMTTLSAQASMAGKDTIEFGIAPYVANVTAAAIVDSILSADGTALFTGLTGNTRYAVWYRYHCGEGLISDWSPMVQGLTMATDCFDPQNLSAGIVDDHSATFTWGAAPSVTRYYYELRQGASASSALIDSGSTVTPQVAYTNLTAMTNYFFRVVGYCSDDTTSWVSLAITTTRTPAPMPFICSFENAGDAAYWEMGNNGGTTEFMVGSATNNGGSSSIYVTNDGGSTCSYSTTTSAQAYARALVPMTAGNYLVSYDYSSMGESSYDYGRLFLYPAVNAVGTISSLSSTTPTGNLTVSPTVLSEDATWNSAQYIVAVPADAMYYFQINWKNDGSVTHGTPLAVDNIRIEPISCMPLTSVATLNINTTSAKFYATRYEAGMEIQYGYSIFDNLDSIQWTSIVNSNLSDTIVLRGLTSSTQYYLYVRELCDSTNVSSPTRVAFKTPSPANNIPFVCSFESNQSATNVWTFANSTANEFVIGSAASSAGSQSLYISNDGGSTNNYTNSSLTYCYAYAPLQFSDGTFDISYDWLCEGESSYYDYGRVFLVPSSFIPQGGVSAGVTNSGAPSGWIAIDGGTSLNKQSSWQSVETEVSFTDSTIMNLLVYWYNDGSAGSNPAFTIDNIMITKQTCPALKFDSIRVDTVSTNMFTVHYYNPNAGAATRWVLCSDMTRLDTVASGIVPAGSNSFTATGLNASTNYYVTLYAICDSADISRPLNFSCRTQCATLTTYPYDEGFESFNAGYYNVLNGACWAVSPAEDASTSGYEHYAFVVNSSQYSQYVHSGDQALAINHGYYYTGSQILAMPEMDTLNGKTVSFSHMAYGTSSYYVQMIFGYINASNQFVTIQSFPLVDEWQDYSTNLTNLPATAHRLAFKFTGEYNYFLDDIHVNRLVQGRTYNDTICFGSAYNGHGISIAAGRLAAGDTTFTKTVRATAAGQADSITTVNIYVRPEIVNATYDTVCQGTTTYNKNGWNITNPTSRTYSQQFTAACGCDSTLSLVLYVQPNQVTLFDSICQGDSYQFGSMTLTQSGQYKDTLASQWGCDIVRTLNLFVSDTATHLYDQTCLGATYVWEGTSYTQSGTYKKTTVGPLGCTLTKYLHLTMTPSDSTCNVSFCRGGSVQIADTIIQTAGTYTFTRVNPATSCNTTYHVTATETQPTPERVNDEACEGKPYYGYGVSGVIITKDTVITQNTRTAAGNCDSVVIATVKLNKTSYGPTENKTIDAGDSYTWHDNTYTTSGVYYYTTTDVNGCDSILKLVLTVGDVPPVAVEDVVMLNISLIPNPVNAGETSFIYGNFTNVKSVEILNSFGQVIDTFVPQTYPIEVQGVNASGVYYVRVVTEDEKVAVEKLIVR